MTARRNRRQLTPSLQQQHDQRDRIRGDGESRRQYHVHVNGAVVQVEETQQQEGHVVNRQEYREEYLGSGWEKSG